MDRFDAMQLFVATVDEGSLVAAARRLGRSPAAATRAVSYLEGLAGETLLLRSTRRLSLTLAGERHVSVWRDVLAKLGEIAPGAGEGPVGGSLVITAPELFGRLKVMPVLESFLGSHPRVSARVLMVNRLVDLVGEGVDLAVRLAPLPDSTLTAIGLGEVRRLVCASPLYLARHGQPDTPGDLENHACIGLNPQGARQLWAFQIPETDRTRSVQINSRLSLNSPAAALDTALRGHGVIQPLSYQVADDLAAGRLVRLLRGFEPPPTPVHMVFHAEPAKRGPVRAFIDHAMPILRRALEQITTALERHPDATSSGGGRR